MTASLESAPALVVDAALLTKYEFSGPRYTSYPTADRFTSAFRPADGLRQLARRREQGAGGPLSLYVHLPFCDTVCYYCACNKVVTRDRSRAAEYLGYLEREIATQRGALGADETVAQLHWGGGTPTFFSGDEMARLVGLLGRYFTLVPDGEYSIEVDPRRIAEGTIERLGALGFNRLSLGVQDFDPVVQKKVNRLQTVEETARVAIAARASGFRSVSFDLIYGLPAQSVDSVARTLDTVLQMRPDRISLYNYAHLPTVFMPQRRIDAAELPSAAEKIRILTLAIDALTSAGYVYIGMDHFALPEDDLAQAQARGTLQRNFQGYSTHARADLLAFGVSAIAAVGDTYAQNHRTLEDYYASLDRGELPVFRGHRLDADDLLRREVIQQLTCNFRLSFEDLARRFGVEFPAYFAEEQGRLAELEADGLIESTGAGIEVTGRGRLLVRVICMVFDRYLRATQSAARYSKVI
ncbi:MAG TPA: oxygen-independent coproporphyrinogen III oxidase [Burkholderiales bacterium]